MVVVSDLSKTFGGSTDLAKKRHGSADLHTPIHPPPLSRLHALSELRSFKKPHVKRLSVKTEHLINLVELKHCHLRKKCMFLVLPESEW